jgi:hypothetical protein
MDVASIGAPPDVAIKDISDEVEAVARDAIEEGDRGFGSGAGSTEVEIGDEEGAEVRRFAGFASLRHGFSSGV